jgi:hypothetical protein
MLSDQEIPRYCWLSQAIGALLYGGTAHAEPTPTPVAIEVLTRERPSPTRRSMQNSPQGGWTPAPTRSRFQTCPNIVTHPEIRHTCQPGRTEFLGTLIPGGPVFVTIAQGSSRPYISSEGRHQPAVSGRHRISFDPGHGHVHHGRPIPGTPRLYSLPRSSRGAAGTAPACSIPARSTCRPARFQPLTIRGVRKSRGWGPWPTL